MTLFRSSGPPCWEWGQPPTRITTNPVESHHFLAQKPRGAFEPCGLGLATPKKKRSAASRIICRPIRFYVLRRIGIGKVDVGKKRKRGEER